MSGPITRILVPTDFSQTSDAALAYAKAAASGLGASLHPLHVFPIPYAAAAYAPEVYAPLPPEIREHALRDIEAHLRERLDDEEQARFQGTVAIVSGLTAKQIVEYAKERSIDLIVMGTHGRRGVAHLLLGSVAEHVVRTAQCPVLTVRDASIEDASRVQTEQGGAALVA
jgi:nucleotide-binding universal stress UspA family protein